MGRSLCLLIIGILIVSIAGCRAAVNHEVVTKDCEAEAGSKAASQKEIIEMVYHKEGIEASYPQFIAGGSKEKLDQWNQLIYHDFEKILQIYSFQPFPEPTPEPSAKVPVILKIGYEIKENTSRRVSIFYTAAFNRSYTAHPTELVYTTTLDKEQGKKLKLSDYVILNDDFVKDFRKWDLITYEEGNEELNQAIRDYISNLSNEDLLKGFEAADRIGSGNLYEINSYLTTDKLGISIGVPNYLGDHVEMEREYTKLGDFLKPEYRTDTVADR